MQSFSSIQNEFNWSLPRDYITLKTVGRQKYKFIYLSLQKNQQQKIIKLGLKRLRDLHNNAPIEMTFSLPLLHSYLLHPSLCSAPPFKHWLLSLVHPEQCNEYKLVRFDINRKSLRTNHRYCKMVMYAGC